MDFISYRDRGLTVTGETYVHLPKGPFADSLQSVILPLAEKENLVEQKEDISEKFGKRNRFKALKKPDMSLFDDYEKKLLEYLCVTFKDWTTDQMVAQTHTEAPWVFSKPSKSLDYNNADDIEFFANN